MRRTARARNQVPDEPSGWEGPDFAPPQGEMSIRDSRSPLTIKVVGSQRDDAYVYTVSVEGEAPNPAVRLAWSLPASCATAR